jgi:hypothetical protein
MLEEILKNPIAVQELRGKVRIIHMAKQGPRGPKGDPGGGGIGGGTLACFDSRTVLTEAEGGPVPCDDNVPGHVLAQKAIDKVSALGGGILYMVGDDPTKKFYFNASVWNKSNVIIVWINKMLMGQYGRTGILGTLDEGVATYLLTANVALNANIIAVNNAAAFIAGDVVEIRGENDANGIATERQRVTVTARNLVDGTITISPAAQFSFAVTYPASLFPNDKTTLKIIKQTPLVTLTEGICDVQVGDASKFSIGDTVLIEDMMVSANISGDSQNQIHMETNVVRSVDTVGNIVTLQLPLAHTYNAAYAPKMIRCISAMHAGHINPHITYKVRQTDNNRHAMQLLHARSCFVSNLKVMGAPAPIPGDSLGSRGHALRIGDGCIFNWADKVEVYRPAFWDAAQGYGVTFYSGARANRVSDVTANGCRHSLLFFKGVTDNVAEGITSIDCRGTDVDFHGANERKNTVNGVKVIGGSSSTPDINLKAALKFGNPTHRAGCSNNAIRHVDLTDYPGYACHFLPSSNNKVEQVTGKSNRGVYFQHLTDDPTLPMENNWVNDIEMYGGVKHVELDGGPNRIVNNCGVRGMKIMGAPMTSFGYQLENAGKFTLEGCSSLGALSDISSYLIQATNITGLEIRAFRGDGAKRFLMLLNCPNAIITAPILSNQTERVVMYDAGGNDNAKFLDFETNYDAKFVDQAAASPGIKKKPRQRNSLKVVSPGPFPAVYTGAGNQIGVGAGVPANNTGTQMILTAFKPKTPKGIVTFVAMFPWVETDLTNTHVATVYYRNVVAGVPGGWQFAGLGTGRITGGSTAGQSMVARGTFTHNIEDAADSIDVMVRLGQTSAAAQTIIGNKFDGAAYPTLELSESD